MRDQVDRAVDIGLAHAGADTPEMSRAAFEAGRERVLAATQELDAPAGGSRRWLVAAASVAVLVTGGLVAQAIDFGGTGSTPRAAAEMLRRAADLTVAVKDTPIGPGQYRYVSRRGVGISVGNGAAMSELITQQTWIPADPRQEWFERRGVEGVARWLPGLAGDGPPPAQPRALIGEWKAKCGAFGYWAEQEKPKRERECDHGSWYVPTAEFLAGLPTDPRQLYERVVTDTHDESPASVVSVVGFVLDTGMVPAEYRARLYRALELVPGLVITDESVNLDGRKGTAVGVRNGKDFMEIIIDPTNGEYIGQRYVVAEEDMGLLPGMVRSFSSTTMGVVDAMGVVPK
jgi:hypothetical protein